MNDGNEVFFRCGNWCYKGRIQFNGLNISTADLPILIPALQKQQGNNHSLILTFSLTVMCLLGRFTAILL